MKTALIELAAKKTSKASTINPDKNKTELQSGSKTVQIPPGPVADISHIYNHRMIEIYDMYFNEDELYTDKDREREIIRKTVAIFCLKNYKLVINESDWEILEIEIYSHDDPYLNLILTSFDYHVTNGGEHPGCLVFWLEAENQKVQGNYLMLISAIRKDDEVVLGRKEVYDKAVEGNYKIVNPTIDDVKDYKFDYKEHVYSAPRPGLTFNPFKDSHQLNLASKHIMKPRSYCRYPKFMDEKRKILYSYQSMRNNEGEGKVADDLGVKRLKLSAWLNKFYKIAEVKDPNYFLSKDFDWFKFDDYLKAFKYFTNFS